MEDAALLGDPEASPPFSSSSLLRIFRPGSDLPALIAGVTLKAHAAERVAERTQSLGAFSRVLRLP